MLYIHLMPAPISDDDLQLVARQCLVRKVRQASRVVTALYDEALRPHGLKSSQMNLLVAIGAMRGATPAALGAGLGLEKSTVSRGTERMVASGWLEARPDPAGRGLSYRLAPRGRALLAAALPDWKRAEAEARRRLGRAGVQAIEALSRQIAPT